MKIGVFDSGVGGLSVLKALYKSKLFEEIIYYGDTARVPYGNKDKATIKNFGIEGAEFFTKFGIDALVVACNTLSAYALEDMQKACNFKIYGVIEAGIDSCIKTTQKDENILILGTRATIASNQYETLLRAKNYQNLTSIATPLFVPLVEEGIFYGQVVDDVFHLYFDDYLLSQQPDTIILGCTHFPLLGEALHKFFKGAKFTHSGEAILEELQAKLNLKKSFDTKLEFHASSDLSSLKNLAKIWLST